MGFYTITEVAAAQAWQDETHRTAATARHATEEMGYVTSRQSAAEMIDRANHLAAKVMHSIAHDFTYGGEDLGGTICSRCGANKSDHTP